MQIAVTGASGYIAQALVPRLAAAGHTLLLVGRDAKALRTLHPAHKAVSYEQLPAALAECDAVLHLAVLNNDSNATLDQFHSVNAALPKRIAEQARNAGVPHFIHFTTFQAIEPPFTTHYAQSKYEGDQALAAMDGLAITLLRLPAVYTGTFRGKLAVLNQLPPSMRPTALQWLGALRPTLHIDLLTTRLLALLASPVSEAPKEILLADGQANNPAYQAMQRALDVSFSLAVIICLWWALAACWLAVKLSSPGPAIFAQRRVGRNGKPFTCYKFRSMRLGSKQAATHEVSADAVTSVGHFIRRTKLDELPQIVNLLKREMSLVGPRPCLESQTQLIEERRTRGVLALNPGITGMAQIKGVDMSDPKKLAKLDATYIPRQSFLLDLKIILATATGKGAQDNVKKTA
jgi:lipopolysaccharide/colanic/teichoic acid biosynthesis glycosyltransferase